LGPVRECEIHAGTVEIPTKQKVVTSDRVIDKALVGDADIADICR
jgi:hypothetical protein